MSATESELLAGTVSAWSTLETDAVLVMVWVAVPESTVAEMSRVADAPLASEPTDQAPEPLSYVPWLGVSDWYVTPAGSRSEMTMLVAVSGPLLSRVMV